MKPNPASAIRDPRSSSPPFVLVRTVATRQTIVALSKEAYQRDIRVGMTLGEARALCATVEHEEHDPIADWRGLEALARWMMRFSPVVALPAEAVDLDRPATAKRKARSPLPLREKVRARGESLRPPCAVGSTESQNILPLTPALSRKGRGRKAPVSPPASPSSLSSARRAALSHHALFLDVTGCERLYGDLRHILDAILISLQRFGISAHVSIAPTPGAAWALAFSRKNEVVLSERLTESLEPLPVEALRLDEELAGSLRHLGLTTIGQVLRLPRELLPARFGPGLLLRVNQALGQVAEPLVPLAHVSPIEAKMELDGVIDSLETIWRVFQELLQQVVADLLKRGCGARTLLLRFTRAYGPPIEKTIRLSRPSRDPVNLFNLMRCALETVEEAGGKPKVRKDRRSFQIADCGLRIEEGHFKSEIRNPRSAISQTYVRTISDGFTAIALSVPLFERVTDEQVRLLEHEEHAGLVELAGLVERLRIRLGEPVVRSPRAVESHVPERAWRRDEFEIRPDARLQIPLDPLPRPAARPLQLLPEPVPVGVVVSPSHDRLGAPVLLNHQGHSYRITHTVGPERIGGEWWIGHHKTRDYFDVTEPGGKRFWIFRVNETFRWYVHGEF